MIRSTQYNVSLLSLCRENCHLWTVHNYGRKKIPDEMSLEKIYVHILLIFDPLFLLLFPWVLWVGGWVGVGWRQGGGGGTGCLLCSNIDGMESAAQNDLELIGY